MSASEEAMIAEYLKKHEVTVVETKEDLSSTNVVVGCSEISGSMV